MTIKDSDESDVPIRIRATIMDLPRYKQGKQAGAEAFKLSSNENPFGPLPSVLAAMDKSRLVNRYADTSVSRLQQRLASRYGVSIDRVHIGAGSLAIITQLVAATVDSGDEVLYAWRSFEAYPHQAIVAGARSVQVPLTAEGRHDLPAMAAAVTERTRVILVCSPNNPTGPAVSQVEFEEFVAAVPSNVLVILDEAYVEFVTEPDAVNGTRILQRAGFDNVVVLRTFSKAYGLAGLRVGYVIGHPRILDAARTTCPPFSVTTLAEDAALASLTAEKEVLERVRILTDRRDRLVSGLREIGWRIPDAQGNFVWLATGAETQQVAETFEGEGLVVRAFAGEGIRITVGEEESIEKVLQVSATILRTLPEDHSVRMAAPTSLGSFT